MSEAKARIFALGGPLTMADASGHLAAGRSAVGEGNCVVDFAAVSESDSVALALLFDWQRHAQAAGHTLSVRNMPEGLASLAVLYGVDSLLPDGANTPGD